MLYPEDLTPAERGVLALLVRRPAVAVAGRWRHPAYRPARRPVPDGMLARLVGMDFARVDGDTILVTPAGRAMQARIRRRLREAPR